MANKILKTFTIPNATGEHETYELHPHWDNIEGKDLPELSKGTTTGTGNAVTDISVTDHTITLNKGETFILASEKGVKNGVATLDTNTKVPVAQLPMASTDTNSIPGITVVYPAAQCTTFSSDSGTVTPLAVQKGAKMFAITRPTTATDNAIVRYSDATGNVKNSKIIIEDVTNTKNKNTANVLAIPAEGGKKMVYGYCTDQDDGTSFIGGVFDAGATEYPYSAGLAIGGTSGNLLWKGKKIATEEEIDSKLAGKSNTNHIHSELQSQINALTQQVEKLTARIALLESWHAMSGYGDINGDGHITQVDADMITNYFNGDIELTAEQIARADVNGDGEISVLDGMLINQYLVGDIDKFPVEE